MTRIGRTIAKTNGRRSDMKTRSKKFYTWKDKWKRKKRSTSSCAWYRETVPKDCIKYYNKEDRAKNKQAVHEIMKGAAEEEVNFKYNHRHSALWDWW